MVTHAPFFLLRPIPPKQGFELIKEIGQQKCLAKGYIESSILVAERPEMDDRGSPSKDLVLLVDL